MVKNLPANLWVPFLDQEDPLEKEMATLCNILGNPTDRGAWRATVHGVAKEANTTWQLNHNRKTENYLWEF